MGDVMKGKWRKSILQALLNEINTEFVEVILVRYGKGVDATVTVDFKPVKKET